MSKHTTPAEELQKRISRALIVNEHGRDGVSTIDYLGHISEADPFQIEEDNA